MRHDEVAGPCGCHAVDGLFLPGDLGHDEDVALVVANVRYGDFERFGRDGRGGQHEAGGQ